jgi:HK97 family phage prohead protease
MEEMTMNKNNQFNIGSRQMRTVGTEFTTREDGEDLKIEGYFAVFNSNYEMAPGISESIAPGAFQNSLANDVRALTNHDTTLVLGRTKAGTLELREDSRGLFGSIRINPNDQDAMNLYERVKRGDVDQCSFGFDIVSEDTEYREDGSVHWTIKDLILYEVSCCTFPAYEETSISARSAQADEIKKRHSQAWKERMLNKLKGEQTDA